MSRTSLRAAVAAAAAGAAIVVAPAAAAATPVPVVYNPQQGPLTAAVTCAPNLLIPFFGGIAFDICWA
ncbi:hypothetical protein ACFWPA_04150 [Rhodococcus sp. NPDC058505]|uniref:hypothetical protein n=1 Tax=unclassified Rhodococcus (in: high G+C Gram-positive bacteria) TaxID=192944 RepID=UPI003656ED1E